MTTAVEETRVLAADSNQARGIAEYAIDFLRHDAGQPDDVVLEKTRQFFTDSVLCGLSAIALGTNAPNVLREEALLYPRPFEQGGATLFGNNAPVAAEKAIVANCAAVREWDSNGTNFGYNAALGHTAGEFGHNDFYAVPLAAAQHAGLSGADVLRGMVCHDEIRGRLAEVFSLKSYKIDHVVHGAIASAAVYGAMLGATAEQIESAIGMTVAHYIPWRAIRAGKQLSDSKGASAALSTEVAVLAMQRSMRGFLGPRDIFRNPEAIFRQFEPTSGDASPFELHLRLAGDDFAVMGMHFKLGLYEHQSAGAIQGVIDLIRQHPHLLESPDRIASIRIVAYEPAFGIIGDPAKRNPTTRQSADHSMVYIISTLLRKALEHHAAGRAEELTASNESCWKALMLAPQDYAADAIHDPTTRALMDRIEFAHGGEDYDRRYPDGIPTSLTITDDRGNTCDSGLVMYPVGHARNTTADLEDVLDAKFRLLGQLAAGDGDAITKRYRDIADLDADQVRRLNDYTLRDGGTFE